MKSPKTAGLCLASMLALGMALAGTAAAEPLWLLCLEGKEGSPPTKYTTNQCTTAAGSNKGKWESVVIGTKSDTVRVVALSLKLEDAKGELGTAVIVKCALVRGGGLIEEDQLKIRELEALFPSKECTAEGTGFFKVCKTSNLEEVEGIHLPWKVELSASGGTFKGKIQPDGAGEPGWKVKCAGVEDTCESEGAGTLGETSGSAGIISAGVLLPLGQLRGGGIICLVGGAKQGHVEGFTAVLLSNGNGLSLHET